MKRNLNIWVYEALTTAAFLVFMFALWALVAWSGLIYQDWFGK